MQIGEPLFRSLVGRLARRNFCVIGALDIVNESFDDVLDSRMKEPRIAFDLRNGID